MAVNNLTEGKITKTLVRFALPYLFASFMQALYGLCDLFVVGLFDSSEVTTAVANGSQIMHMLTVIILGFAMGTTVNIGRAVGAKDDEAISKNIGNSISFFAVFSFVSMVLLLLFTDVITKLVNVPKEAIEDTKSYLYICFLGIPFIIAYNVISSIFRGMGDSKSPMIFVAIACGINMALDFLFVGTFSLGSKGAALATVLGQLCSVLFAVAVILKDRSKMPFNKKDLRINKDVLFKILAVGTPIALQDGCIQISFLVITAIANSRGLIDATAVGIVEKIICFLFLVPSSFLAAISATTAQNMGAGRPDRAKKSLYVGLLITMIWGSICAVYCQFLPETLVGIFSTDSEVVTAGGKYLMSYGIDVLLASIHFCMSGYFCGDQKSGISFIHNIISIVLIRIPGAYLANEMFPKTLYPMGLAAPCGSLLSVFICFGVFVYYRKRDNSIKNTQ